jgi:hypothetical protein
MIDIAWEGTIFIEAEGTNEGLAELQERCGPEVRLIPSRGGARPSIPPPGTMNSGPVLASRKTVFRMIRAQSRPGELWLRCAREKEKLLSQ